MPPAVLRLDADGKPTQKIEDFRRKAKSITPIPKPKKRNGAAAQGELGLDEGMSDLFERRWVHGIDTFREIVLEAFGPAETKVRPPWPTAIFAVASWAKTSPRRGPDAPSLTD